MHTTDLGHANKLERAFDFSRRMFATLYSMAHGVAEHDVYNAPGFERLKTVVPASTVVPLADPAAKAFQEVHLQDELLQRIQRTSGVVVMAPPNTPVPSVDITSNFTWVAAEGAAIPLAQMTATSEQLSPTKIAGMVAFPRETFRVVSDPGIRLVQQRSVKALTDGVDTALLSDTAAVPGVSAAGFLHGLMPVATGSPDSLFDDVQAGIAGVRGGEAISLVGITSKQVIAYLAALHHDGVPMFPNLNIVTGGTIFGMPVLLSRAAGTKLIFLDAGALAVSDLGVEVQRSDNAPIQMLSDPTNNSVTGTHTTVVSAFQSGMVVLKLIRWVNWVLLAPDAVSYIEMPVALGSPS